MNTPRLSPFARLVAAVGAGSVTAALFAGVVSFAEPQRSTLIAKAAAQHKLASSAATLQVADARR